MIALDIGDQLEMEGTYHAKLSATHITPWTIKREV